VHPSSLLRIRDPGERRREHAHFVADRERAAGVPAT
jgi:hypothetical protein